MSLLVSKHSDVISASKRNTISGRYKAITKAINKEFWNSKNDYLHSFYAGSYGRNTAISTSDIDIIVEIPNFEYDRFKYNLSNGPSRFLQVIRKTILELYPRSDVRADGQVVKINFSDDILFEIIPVFRNIDYIGNWSGTYIYPDSNMGGNWLTTNPKAEQEAMKELNEKSNGLLNATCRHLRYVRDNYFSSYTLSGIVIDSFVYKAIGDWKYVESGSGSAVGSYERKLLTYFNDNYFNLIYLTAPGSNQQVDSSKSLECLKKVLEKIVNS